MARHTARRAAMQLIYENMLGGEGGDDTLYGMIEYPADDEDVSYAVYLAKETESHYGELDAIISNYSKARSIDRIPLVTMAILRLALFEIHFCPDTPNNVVINEAVEMAKRYSELSDGRFINGLLGAYVRDHAKE